MRRSNIAAIFFASSICCLIINIFIAPDLGWDYDVFPMISGMMAVFLIFPTIMAIKETEDISGKSAMGNARSCGCMIFFILLLTSFNLPSTENIQSAPTFGLFFFLWILSDILCLIGAFVYKSGAAVFRKMNPHLVKRAERLEAERKQSDMTDEEIINLPLDFWLMPWEADHEEHCIIVKKKYRCLNCKKVFGEEEYPVDVLLRKADVEAMDGKKYRRNDKIKSFSVPDFKYTSTEKTTRISKYKYGKPYPFQEHIVKYEGLYFLDKEGYIVGTLLTKEQRFLPRRDGEKAYKDHVYYPDKLNEDNISCMFCIECLDGSFGSLISSTQTQCTNCLLYLVKTKVHRCGECGYFTCYPCWNSGVKTCKNCGSTYFDT
jgi:hypothetical protein